MHVESSAAQLKPAPHFNRKQLAVLRAFLDSLSPSQRRALAGVLDTRTPSKDAAAAERRTRSIVVYLSQLRSGNRRASIDFARRLVAASGGRLRLGDVRPDTREDA